MPKPEELPESIILQGFTGLKNTVSPERLTAAELEDAVNIDLDDVGQARRRRGYNLKSAGDFHSVKTVGGKTYGVKDGSLGIVREDYSFTALGVTVGPAPVCYTCVDNKVYFSSSTAQGVVQPDETIIDWGATDGQGTWWSPVIVPTDTLGAVSGKLLGDPKVADVLEAYNGRIYLAHGKILWATELFQYHYVDRTKNFMQFEHDITLLMAMDDGLYVGTEGGLYFLKGRMLGAFALSIVVSSPVLRGSGVWVPADLVHPQALNSPIPTGDAAVFMTETGVCAGFDGGTVYNLTQAKMIFPSAISAAALFRQQDGVNQFIAAADSAGGPSANTRIGDYVDAEIIRFGGA
jgi:hypothetical protein